MVALVGEAGVGKSRIFLEFARSLGRGRAGSFSRAGSVSYGKATSYLPLIDLLSGYFEIQSRDSEQQVRERIARKLLALGDEKLFSQLPLFAAALGIRPSDDGWTNITPFERQSLIFDALKRLLVRKARNNRCAW